MQCLTETSAGVFTVASPQPTIYTECTNILATPQELIINQDMSYNFESAVVMWSFGFVTVLTLWFAAKNAGVLLAAIKKL